MFNSIMRWVSMKYISWVILALLSQVPRLKSCTEEEKLALYELKSYIKSQVDPNNIFDSYSGWLEGPIERHNCCAWDRVRCNPTTRRVIELDLNGVVFRQIIQDDAGWIENPPWLFNVSLFLPFTELRSLDLSDNTITGLGETEEFTKLTKLQVLDLSSNYINGSMQELANFTELLELNLESNMFSGTIQGICTMKKLRELRLFKNYFHGNVPSCLHNLSTLQVFDISTNNFKGVFPKMLLNITSLKELSLSDNYFEGKLSLSSFSNHSKLQLLELSRNSLEVQTEDSLWHPTFQLKHLGFQSCSLNKPEGTFPKFLSYQHSLLSIDLSNNSLVGNFPSWLLHNNSQLQDLELTNNSLTGYLLLPDYTKPSLQSLAVAGNQFRGKVQEDIGFFFPNLSYLDMSRNHFEGQIPTSISQLGLLWLLDLSHNNFSGELPRQLLSHCNNLGVLRLSDNNLQGEIIPEHMNLPVLTLLQLSNNYFSGTIKDSLQISSNLISLDISNNEVMGQLPRWIGNFISLKAFLVSNNSFQGQIPTEICKLQLSYLDLSQNNFTGSMPSCSNFSSLLYMHLHKNKLQGSIPNVLSSCSSLQSLDLRDNLFSGSIPLWIKKLSSLRLLLLGGNNLQGKVPHQLCQLANMNILDLSQNHLFGRIPTCLWNMSFGRRIVYQFGTKLFSYDFDIGTNHYFIQETVEILSKHEYLSYADGNRLLMSGLDLSCNNLSSVIPPELGNLRQIHSLNLSHNHLSGSIPSSFSNLKQVESLDLSYNNLSGNIPPQLVDLNFLAIFNVSYNNLTGRTPETGQFANFDVSNYLGNPLLCGLPLNKSCEPIQPNALHPPSGDIKQGGNALIDKEDFLWSFSVSSVIILIATLVVLGINPQWREAWFDFVEWHLLRRFL